MLAAFFALTMPETTFAPLPREERGSFAQMRHTGAHGARLVRARPALLAILGIAAFAGMWSEGYDRLWQAHFIRDIGLPSLGGLDPVVWFGVFGAGTILLSIAVAHPLGKRLEHRRCSGWRRRCSGSTRRCSSAPSSSALPGCSGSPSSPTSLSVSPATWRGRSSRRG